VNGTARCVCAILAGALLALVPSPPLDSVTPPGPSPLAPHPAEVALLEELAAWVWDGDEAAASLPLAGEPWRRPDLHALASRELVASLPYGDQILRASREHRVDSLLLAAVVETESAFDPGAVSPRGALGLMQVMPATALGFGVGDPQDPVSNLDAGARYLGSLLESFDGRVGLALAAYNAGPAAVRRHGGVPPFPETARYVEKVVRIYLGHLRSVWQAESLLRGTETSPLAAPAAVSG
jgi:hypothetical protein